MKKLGFLILITLFLSSCKDDYVDGNTYLPNVTVNFSVNLLLPEGNGLLQSGGFKIFTNKGIRGVIVFNNGLGYTAFDLACPHVSLQECSTMTFSASDLSMTCPCDDEKFSKLDGAPLNPDIRQVARAYIVTENGNTLYIRN